MEDTPEYATFDVIKYIKKRYGAAPSAKVYHQIGTFQQKKQPISLKLKNGMQSELNALSQKQVG